jgi:hypothetical protein
MAHVVVALFVGWGIFALERLIVRANFAPRLVAPFLGVSFTLPLALHEGECDLRADRIGGAFARDLAAGVPEKGVALIVGEDMVGATNWACGVLRACKGQAVFSPGQLHMPWRVRQLRRRYPDLVLPERAGPADLVEANDARSVAIAPQLLDIDPRLRSGELLPDRLLVRVVKDDITAHREPYLAYARGLLDPSGCEGCATDVARAAASPLEANVRRAYGVALENHSRVARVIFGAGDVADALEARGRELERIR